MARSKGSARQAGVERVDGEKRVVRRACFLFRVLTKVRHRRSLALAALAELVGGWAAVGRWGGVTNEAKAGMRSRLQVLAADLQSAPFRKRSRSGSSCCPPRTPRTC